MTLRDNAMGCLLGLAIGDALGVPAEFKQVGEFDPITGMRGGGPFRLNIGEWTDDTSMALCIANSLVIHNDYNPTDILTRFCAWWNTGAYSHNDRCFDIGTTTKKALIHFQNTKLIEMPDTDSFAAGNGSIMRFAPVAVFYHNNIDKMVEVAIAQSKMTHPTPECIRECETLARIIHGAMHGIPKENLFDCEQYKNIPSELVPSDGYVVSTMHAAQWAVANTDNFKDALLLAVNLGDDADTVGAVTGQIAGALYGMSSIPQEWLDVLVWRDKIKSLTTTLYDLGHHNCSTCNGLGEVSKQCMQQFWEEPCPDCGDK